MTGTVWPVDAVTGAPSYSGRLARQAMSVFLAGATTARPLGSASGVRPGTSTATVTATSTTWTVKPHAGVIDAQTALEAGAYAYAFDANETGSVTAADATYARKDIVWVRIDDPSEDASSTPAVVAGYTAGVASASPAVPATPARSMVLAEIDVPASGGGSPTVTWVAPSLGAAESATGTVSMSVTSLAAGSGTFQAVSFGKTLAATPVVTVSLAGAPSGSVYLVPRALSASTTGFNLYFYNLGTTAATATGVTVAYHAVVPR